MTDAAVLLVIALIVWAVARRLTSVARQLAVLGVAHSITKRCPSPRPTPPGGAPGTARRGPRDAAAAARGGTSTRPSSGPRERHSSQATPASDGRVQGRPVH